MNQPRHRTAGVALIAALLGSLLALGPADPAAAAVVKPIMFPVDGAVTYTRDFGACRAGCSRSHEGNDLIGKKMLPLLAAVDGVVFRLTFSNTSSGGNSVTIKAADGWTYHYIHVNNDTPGTDNAQATREQAFPSTVVVGAAVKKGQVIAFMGDSGNAEGTSPHLHFEMRQPAVPGQYVGTPIDPYDSLQAATRGIPIQRWELRRTPTAGPTDDFFSWGIQPGDDALLCDWDGDGLDESVIFRSGIWHLRDGLATGATLSQVAFGTATDTPLCGNVDGDPADEPLVFAAGAWTIRAGFGAADGVAASFRYGVSPGDQPVLGDWDGNGLDDIAIYREGGGWHIRSNASVAGGTIRTFTYGIQSGDRAVAGDWDGNGLDDIAIYRKGEWHLRSNAEVSGRTVRSFFHGAATDQPVAGRWTGAAAAGLGVFRPKSV